MIDKPEDEIGLVGDITWDVATNKVIEHYGYIVLGSNMDLPIGYVTSGIYFRETTIRHPFRIISKTDFEDYKAQCEFVGIKCVRQLLGPYFYRAVTD